MDVKGRVTVVTGSSRGIGKAIAVKLAEEADIVVNYVKNHKATEDTLKLVRSYRVKAYLVKGAYQYMRKLVS